MRSRATLIIDDQRALGWLTDDHPDSSGVNLDKALGPDDLAPDHIIGVHGGREVKEVFMAADKSGSTISWPAEELSRPCN